MTKINTTITPSANVINEEKALELTSQLIANPNVQPAEIPNILKGIFDQFNAAFAPVVEVVAKKRRRKARPEGSAPLGWPAGVGRVEFKEWKDAQIAKGNTDNLNPHVYKGLRDSGKLNPVAEKAVKAAPATATAGTKKQAKDAGITTASQEPVASGNRRGGVGRGTSKAGK